MGLHKKLSAIFSISILVFGCALVSSAQDTATIYLQRAEKLYSKIWRLYRTPGFTGLFSENFPSRHSDTLTYFQGGGVKEKEVSFLWPFSGMFSATNVLLKFPSERQKYLPYLDTLIIGVEKYRDTSRSPDGYQAYPVEFEKADRYYDDNGLVGIEYMESFFNTGDSTYLKRAREVFKFIISGWSNDLGGGVTWLEGHNDQKPACSNGTATLVALKIYQGNKDQYYLKWGERFYNWINKNLKDSATGVISNDKKPNGIVNRTFWTYNTGFMLESAVMLYKFTGNKRYLNDARSFAKNAYNHFAKVSSSGKISLLDMPWFLTVLFRGYEALYYVDGNTKYIRAVMKNVNDAWKQKDQYGLVYKNWYGSKDEMTSSKWLLDEACIVEFYARMSLLERRLKK